MTEYLMKSFLVLTTLFCSLVLAEDAPAGDKKRYYSDTEVLTMPPPGPNPRLSYLPADAEVDWAYWDARNALDAIIRAQAMAAGRRGPVVVVAEQEPNDSLATAQVIGAFGSGGGEDSELTVSGTIAAPAAPTPFMIDAEDNGDISSATSVVIASGEALTADGEIGDGPHGSASSGSGDFDFFELQGITAGDLISISVTTDDPIGDLDPNTAIWNDKGTALAFNEDIDSGNFDSRLVFRVPADGTYYFSIGGWKTGGPSAVLPGDPFDSGSGTGAASEGNYTLEVGLNSDDVDCFGLDLEPGDMLGASGSDAVGRVELFLANGDLQIGASDSASGIYPAANPLPGGPVTVDFVSYESDRHTVCVRGSAGSYDLDLGVFRQIFEGSENRQILFVDFDGAEVNTSIFGGPNQLVTLSPLSSFLANWGLLPEDEDALIDAILASMEESITADLAAQSNPAFAVEIRNSRDNTDNFGSNPNVSRLIVGGTIAESGLQTIGIAQSIDPGNFAPGETALTLLDLLSAPASNPNSLNQYAIAPGASKIDLVATGIGNITAHEAGHYLGNWHTENSAAGTGSSIMDRGGNLAGTVGVGPDLVFGTADDEDVDFTPDLFSFAEGFSGTQHTNEKTAFALTGDPQTIFSDSFE